MDEVLLLRERLKRGKSARLLEHRRLTRVEQLRDQGLDAPPASLTCFRCSRRVDLEPPFFIRREMLLLDQKSADVHCVCVNLAAEIGVEIVHVLAACSAYPLTMLLNGMGIDVKNVWKNGDEAKTGKYTGGKGGGYQIVCHEPTQGATDLGRSAMENCLAKNQNLFHDCRRCRS